MDNKIHLDLLRFIAEIEKEKEEEAEKKKPKPKS